MKYYYVGRTAEEDGKELVILKPVKASAEEIEMPLEDLKELSKTCQIYGYNKITGMIKTISRASAIDMINAKLKLANYTTNSNNKPVYLGVNKCCEETVVVDALYSITVDTSQNLATLKVFLPDFSGDIANSCYIRWDEMLRQIVDDPQLSTDIDIRVNIIMEGKYPEEVMGISYMETSENITDPVMINNITLSENFDLSETRCLDSLFCFSDPNYYNEEDEVEYTVGTRYIDTTQATIDMSNVNVDNITSLFRIFYNYEGKFKLPRFNKFENCREVFSYTNIDTEKLKEISDKICPAITSMYYALYINNSCPVLSDMTIDDIDIETYYKLQPFMKDCRIKKLVVNKPMKEVTKLSNMWLMGDIRNNHADSLWNVRVESIEYTEDFNMTGCTPEERVLRLAFVHGSGMPY